jgi:hypothetical protein
MPGITQRISLDGSEDIKTALEELGVAGESRFSRSRMPPRKPKSIRQPRSHLRTSSAQAREVGEQSLAIAEATSKSSPEIEQIGKAAAAAAEGLQDRQPAARRQIIQNRRVQPIDIDQIPDCAGGRGLTALGRGRREGMVKTGMLPGRQPSS